MCIVLRRAVIRNHLLINPLRLQLFEILLPSILPCVFTAVVSSYLLTWRWAHELQGLVDLTLGEGEIVKYDTDPLATAVAPLICPI